MRIQNIACIIACVISSLVPAKSWIDASGLAWSYEVFDGQVEIGAWRSTAIPRETAGRIEIPETIEGCPVTRIGQFAFERCSELTEVVVPSCVEEIEGWAFSKCTKLQRVTLGEGLKTIDAYAFSWCSSLKDMKIPAGVETIGFGALAYCQNLGKVYFLGDCPILDNRKIYDGESDVTQRTPASLVSYVSTGARGWVDPKTSRLPILWAGRKISYGVSPTPSIGGDAETWNLKRTYIGLAFNDEDNVVGIVQLLTAVATSRGVKVNGFLMQEDGKKVILKATGSIESGQLRVRSTVKNLGDWDLVMGAEGFSGSLGPMKLVSSELNEHTGVIKATVKFSYLDPHTGKLKNKNLNLGAVVVDGEASGSLTGKNGEKMSVEARAW